MKKLFGKITAALLVLVIFSTVCVCAGAVENDEMVSVSFVSDGNVFRTAEVAQGGRIAAFYDVPHRQNSFFKGWYYDENGDDSPVNFSTDGFSEDTRVYAHWLEAGEVTPSESDLILGDSFGGFELLGVQLRGEDGGLRFITALSESLLSGLDGLSQLETDGEAVEYGFVATKKSNIDNWFAYAGNKVDPDLYSLGYNGGNVNGVDTTAATGSFQGFVKNIKCNGVSDYRNTDSYRLYTLAVTYEDDESRNMTDKDIAARAYIRYYDANSTLRTAYGKYGGTDTMGGCQASLDSAEYARDNTRYYTSFDAVKADANALTTENGTQSRSGAVASMYIRDNTAYISLFADALCTKGAFSKKAEINLNGNTLNVGAMPFLSSGEVKLSNGTVSAGESAPYFTYSVGDIYFNNVTFSTVNSVSTFGGVFNRGAKAVMNGCRFDIDYTNTSGMCGAVVTTSAAVIKDCDFSVRSDAQFTGVIQPQSGSLTLADSSLEFSGNNSAENVSSFLVNAAKECDSAAVSGCVISSDARYSATALRLYADESSVKNTSITMRSDSADYCAYAVSFYDAASSAELSDSVINMSGTANQFIGVSVKKAEDTPAQSMNLLCSGNVFNFNCGLKDGGSSLLGISVNSNVKADIRGSKFRTSLAAAGEAYAIGVLTSDSADISVIGCDILSKTTGKSYGIYGIYTTGASTLRCSGTAISVPAVDDSSNTTRNIGIVAKNNSKITIDEDDGAVLVKGGNTGISNYNDAMFYIKGGSFCSPTHGGAYLGGKGAEITGGDFYCFYQSGFTQYGGMYVTHNAHVNVENAKFRNGIYAIRTKGQSSSEQAYPIVNVKNCYLEATNTNNIFSVSAGEINDLGGNTTHLR